jgi:dolichol kinase
LQEVLRKTTHTFALIIPAGYQVLGLSKGQMLYIMVPITALMIVIDISRLRHLLLWKAVVSRIFGRMIRRHEEEGDWTGATYILLSVCLTVALFIKPIAVAALAFIMVGDTLAALVGRRYGRLRFGQKSIEGSLACLVGTVAVALIVPGLSLRVGIIGAFLATVVEAAPLGIDDNITVPLLSGLGMTLAAGVLSAA